MPSKAQPVARVLDQLIAEECRRQYRGMTFQPKFEQSVCPNRKWRFDLAYLDTFNGRVAIEIHGKTWRDGRHTRGAGFARDREKMNAAVERGWKVLEYTTDQVERETDAVVKQIVRVLFGEPPPLPAAKKTPSRASRGPLARGRGGTR